jgi:hypothetical protein
MSCSRYLLQFSLLVLQFTLSHWRIADLGLRQVSKFLPENLARGIFRNGIDKFDAPCEALVRSHLLC